MRRTTAQTWETEGQDTPTTVSISEQSSDGLRSWQTVRGLTTSSVTGLDGSGGRTITTTAPDGTVTAQSYRTDRLQSTSTSHPLLGTLGSVSFGYDAHGRLENSTDARNGTTRFTYLADDQIHTVTTPDPDAARSGGGYDSQTTLFGYEAAGRQNQVTYPDGGVATTEYYPTGLVKKVSGVRIYPEERTYDSQGRLKTVKTWQDHAAGTGAAVTTWNYHPQRGWLESKHYADNTGPSYTYTPTGQQHTRTWARGVSTTYAYNATGELTGIDYSDATPDVFVSYDRAGQPRVITDGAGTRTLAYDPSGQIDAEIYTSGLLNGLSVDRDFDSLSRLSGISVPAVYSVGYAYDSASRLGTVTTGTNTATYGYTTNSPLVGSVTIKQGAATRLTTILGYDALNRLASIMNTPSGSASLAAAYVYDAANQRILRTGKDGRYWSYSYDALGQVTSGKKYLSGATPINGLDHAWTFDDIGNRKTATVDAHASNYATNVRNQYSQRSVPGVINVIGEAQADATVTLTVNSDLPQPVTRQGDLFFKQVRVDNAIAAQQTPLKVTGVKNLVGASGEDAVTEISRSAFTAQSPEVFTHDADGNLTSDARWTYIWDAENRLIAVETSISAASAGAPRQKLEFAHDAQSRRISKKVYDWSTSTSAWTLHASLRFIYDGWNLLAEVDDTGAAVRTYVWGLDLSGSLQGAGGVGGLLFAILGTGTYATVYDGNGNVGGYVDQTTGGTSAEFEYGAFGETLKTDGPAAEGMPFRFSTKYADIETSLLYYGYRCYNTATGRWLNRDPREEGGGINLYGYVDNNPVNRIDPLGLETYFINRDLSVFGQSSRSRANIVTHTFVATTNPDGSVKHTYSWGNDANLHGWNLDQPLDLMTAKEALSKGQAQRAGADSLDPFVAAAFAQLDKPENEHVNLFVANNCKVEARKLVATAKQRELEAAIANFFMGFFNLDGLPGRSRFWPPVWDGGDR